MTFFEAYFTGLLIIWVYVTLAWILSVYIKNAGIVDIFWGLGFVLLSVFYFNVTTENTLRQIIVQTLITIWGLRLSIHIFIRNFGKPEDYRYKEFRKHYGAGRYWWLSYFQVFLLQGVLIWLISAPLLSIKYFGTSNELNVFDFLGIAFWLTGFMFEAGGDWQLARFKANSTNKGKLMQTGFWKYTRHPNYFGDAAVWWGFAMFSVAANSFVPVLSAVLMNWLLIKVSGVSMLERTLRNTKPGFEEYMKRTSAFFPWFPKTINE
ncbi:MAG: DUF1295 domain-containing protein [Draconibacterium sp.]|nr:DUF1295 domain-containing protein [Draconibacterium sp.]